MKVDVEKHIITYVYGDYGDPLVDIVIDPNGFEAWLYPEDSGVKMFMFGMSMDGIDLEEFVNIVHKNIPDYLELYKKNYWDVFETF